MGTAVTKSQLDAVKAVMRARNALVERIESALAADDLPPLSWYDVFRALEDAPHGLRPRDLGAAVALTPSGLTRLLDRIHAAGLVERKACPSDRRGYVLELTGAGRKTLELMRPVYMRAVEDGFAGIVSAEEAKDLAPLLDRITDSACTLSSEAA
jgi:DNA-binding MarR family transcriptional regulator